MKRTSLHVVLFALAAGGLLVWSRSASSGAVTSPSTPAGQAVLSNAPALVAAPGRVEPISEEIDVAAELPGRVREMLVDEGDRVQAGQVIARLEASEYEARVSSARASLAVAEAEYQRLLNGARTQERREARAAADQAHLVLRNAEAELTRRKGLAAEGVISKEELDRAERDTEVARARARELDERAATVDAPARDDERARAAANVQYARARLAEAAAQADKTVVRAPIAGTIVRRHKQQGESVSMDAPGAALLVTLADVSVLRVRVDVDERDVARLATGQRVFVTADAYGAKRFGGHVVRIGEILGRKNVRTDEPTERIDTKVLETLIELDPGVRLPLGLRVDAFIDARSE